MGQRRKQYLGSEDNAKLEKVLSLIEGDIGYAREELKKNNPEAFLKILNLIEVRARMTGQGFDKMELTVVTDHERALLAKEGFTMNNTTFDKFYLDFERVVPGFGETNDDRNERITYSAVGNVWYGTVRHIPEDGDTWYEQLFPEHKKLKDAIASLEKNREKAPKKKEDVYSSPSNS